MSASAVFSVQWCEMPPIEGTNSMPAGMTVAENLGVVTGAARHAQRPAAGTGCAGLFDGLAGRSIHQRGRTGANALHRDAAAALFVDFRGHAAQEILQPRNHGRIVVADLEQHFRSARDDAGRAGIEGNTAGGPHRARAAGRGEALVDIDAKPGEGEACVLADRHPRGAGVVLFAREGDAVLPDPDDGA